MSDREAMKLALEALEYAERNHGGDDCYADSITALRTALAAPRPEPVLPEAITCGMPFVIKHYTADLRPTIKGNGFDGLEIGISREEAEEFVAWVNARIAAPPAAAPSEDNEALRRDAERYRWLRDNARGRALSVSAICWELDPRKCDAAIDAAMEDKT
jgi:hypothetical protein